MTDGRGTFEQSTSPTPESIQEIDAFQHLIVELVVLTFLIVALVVSLVLLRKRGLTMVADRAT